MRIQILDLDKHRNETTFRPYLSAKETFKKYDIEFVDERPDIYWVGQSSVMNKKVGLTESVDQGIRFVRSLDVPYILFDGQDSSSLIGVWDVFRTVPGYKLVKNVTLKDYTQYTKKYPNGRWFWGEDPTGYHVKDEDLDLLRKTLVHSGTNWLNTFGNNIQFYDTSPVKKHDVAVLIGLSPENYEFNVRTDHYYNKSRLKLFDVVKGLGFNCITTEKTGKLDKQKYMQTLYESRVCVSPFGYGEVNIREIECLMLGVPVIKPNIDCVQTNPFIYGDFLTYECENDFDNLKNVIQHALDNDQESRKKINKQRNLFLEKSNDEYIVNHVINNILN